MEANEQITKQAPARTGATTSRAAKAVCTKKCYFQSSWTTPRCVLVGVVAGHGRFLQHLAGVSPCEFPAGVRIQRSQRQRPRREWSQCPVHLAAAQRSPRAPWPWLWVCLRSHGTAQNRLLLIAQDSEPGEEGALVVVGGRR